MALYLFSPYMRSWRAKGNICPFTFVTFLSQCHIATNALFSTLGKRTTFAHHYVSETIALYQVQLTLRLLMSYIYMEHLFLMFIDHTQRRTTVGRTPPDE